MTIIILKQMGYDIHEHMLITYNLEVMYVSCTSLADFAVLEVPGKRTILCLWLL